MVAKFMLIVAIAFVSLLPAIGASANSVAYGLQQPGYERESLDSWEGMRVGSDAVSLTGIDNLRIDHFGKTYSVVLPVLPVVSAWRKFHDGSFSQLPQDLFFSSSDGYTGGPALQMSTAIDVISNAAEMTSGNNVAVSSGTSHLREELRRGFRLSETSVAAFGRSAPRPGSLIVLGLGLLGFAIAIRRMTSRTAKDADTNRDSERPESGIDREPEADDPELTGPAAPLFHRDAPGRADSISLSQPS